MSPSGGPSIYDQDLPKRAANYRALSPIDFLRWAADVQGPRLAVIDGPVRRSWTEMAARCRQLASALVKRGIGSGNTVSILCANRAPMLEAHYGIPMSGAVINAINFRLDPASIAFILEHAETKVLLVDSGFAATAREALAATAARPLVVDIDGGGDGSRVGGLDYEALLDEGDPEHPWRLPGDEWDAISLCYTSGTTGNPKGVVYHHRGAYLNALGNAFVFGLRLGSSYLWTLPMFHCNGWSYTWGATAAGATHVCLPKVEPREIFRLIAEEGVTHMCGAPIVLNMLIHAPDADKRRPARIVEVATGGAAPPSAVIEAMQAMGFHVTHLYGLTESYGPATICLPQDDWPELNATDLATRMARQGVRYPTLGEAMVADPQTLEPVPADGTAMGEIMLRGHTVMKGYLKNPKATAQAFDGDWYHTGDLAVLHDDGYAMVKDRAKDIIISGGENISSLEIEEVLYRHPSVMEAAVVAMPDKRWGESPCAFVSLKPDCAQLDAAMLLDWCRSKLARFKVPRRVVFGPLPKTSTGKIQKFTLRAEAEQLADG